MDNFFIITSTINCKIGVFSTEERLQQTKDTIASIRKYAHGSKIVFIDNSNEFMPLDLDVDYVVPFQHNIFTLWCNNIGSKGVGEAYMLYETFKFLKANTIRPKRIFKMSGRYKLAEGFDINVYNDDRFNGMYAFRVNDWDVNTPSNEWKGSRTVRYLETRLYSFCGTLLDEYENRLNVMFDTMLKNFGKLMCNWEMNHCQSIPDDKLIEMNPIYIEGLNAENGVYRFE